ncbi:murein transglycosylase domain-containing protein [Terasakiella sp. SH-1]|uniref:transglycosylase SLT domain-containing protein n=1 Tax=Terasakiella sp. SH-1 TaxID=2560057 RepID=UPI0010731FE4|nr:murein transglycosylase domain-containing protein [Terasakiella sp. SH-1]
MTRSRFSYRLLCGTLACAVAIPALGWAQADWLDKIDSQFEQTFQKTDAAFDKALREGVEELDRELADIWGDSRQLPEPKVWVGYNKDKTSRIIVDYERGEMSIEGLDKEEKDLFGDFQEILMEDSSQLDERALLRKKLKEKSDQFWQRQENIVQDQPREKRPRSSWKRPKQDATIQWKRPRELSTLVAPRVRPKFIKRNVALSKGKRAQLSRITIPLRKNRDQLSAQALRGPILEAAQKYMLPRSLILSVIKNESSFNPRARSHANAMGLMQLVATSGGKEAYSYLLGHEATPGPDVLYDPYENIMLGATYLHLLNTRYFGKVTNETARQYLVISAYNTGAGNVAKAFTGKMKLRPAIQKINQMDADAIYKHLQAHLPYAETKTYLARVHKDTKTFASWDS